MTVTMACTHSVFTEVGGEPDQRPNRPASASAASTPTPPTTAPMRINSGTNHIHRLDWRGSAFACCPTARRLPMSYSGSATYGFGLGAVGRTSYVLMSAGLGVCALTTFRGQGTGILVPQSGHSTLDPN